MRKITPSQPTKSPTRFQPPQPELDERGRPDIKAVLKEAEKSNPSSRSNSSANSPINSPRPTNPNVYSITPVGFPRTMPKPPGRSGPLPEQRRLANSSTPPKSNSPTRSPAKSPANSEDFLLARAARDSRRRNEQDDFAEIVPLSLPPPPSSPASSQRPFKPAPSSSRQLTSKQEQMLNDMREKMNKELAVIEEIPNGYITYKTSGGVYHVPDYSKKSKLEIEHERIHLIETIRDMNTKFNKYHMHFASPDEKEDITTVNIRVQKYRHRIKKRTGTNLWWFVLAAIFAAVEKGLCWMGYKADGLMMCQLKQYKLYESQMIELGEGSGFGEDWPPWVQTGITMGFGCAIFVGLTTYGGKGAAKYAGSVMKTFGAIITGSETVAVDENGNALPEDDNVFDKITGFMDKFQNASLSDMMSMGSLMMGGFGGGGEEKKKGKSDKKPKSKEDKKKAKEERLKKAQADDD